MARILYPPPRPQSVGEILDLSFRIFAATLVKCLPYSFAGVILSQLPNLYDLATGQPLARAAFGQVSHGPVWWLLFVVAILLSIGLHNAVLLRQYALATGHPAATGSELGRGLRRAPGTLLIGILMGLAMVATFIPVILVVGAVLGIGKVAPMSAGFIGAMAIIGLLLLACASWVLVRWVCSAPIYLLTERTAVESMSYSWQLTRGSFWRLTAIYGVAMVLILVFYALASAIGAVFALFVAHGDVAVITATWVVTVTLLGALFTPLYSGMVLAVFGDVSVRREGADLEQRISAPAAP